MEPVAGMVGFIGAGVFMAAGLLLANRLPRLGTGLLWASGLTLLWSVLGASAQPIWIPLAGLGLTLAVGLLLGWRHHWRKPDAAEPADVTPPAEVEPPASTPAEPDVTAETRPEPRSAPRDL